MTTTKAYASSGVSPPQTSWQTAYYDPDALRAYYAALFDSVHHLVYAALIDGVCTVKTLMQIIPRQKLCIQWVLQDLCEAGYAVKTREPAIGNKVAYKPL